MPKHASARARITVPTMADTDRPNTDVEQTGDITYALARNDYPEVIALVREAITADPQAALNDPVINSWLGRRYRNIFLEEAVSNPDVVKNSQAPFPISLVDPRSSREKVAKRMISNISDGRSLRSFRPPSRAASPTPPWSSRPACSPDCCPTWPSSRYGPKLINRFRVKIAVTDSHPMRSTEANVADLENVIEHGVGVSPIDASFITADLNPVPPGDIVLMGYSKGAPDILTLLARRPIWRLGCAP